MKCNAIFEGGGVRGIGHIGAAYALEEHGYVFENVAGCSAGAIVAALIAVGYTTLEIKEILEDIDYLKFKHKNFLNKLGPLGKFINLYKYFGLYKTDYFQQWLSGLLEKKGKVVFGDIKTEDCLSGKCEYKLQVIASDITDKVPLVLPQDLRLFGIDPDEFSIAEAVRMSMGIPFFYRPYILKDSIGKEHFIVDGGLLSNYPIYLLDDNSSNPPYPTFGFKFVEKQINIKYYQTKLIDPDLINYIRLITTTALDGHDNQYISKSKGDLERTIAIPVMIDRNGKQKYINSTYFSISKKESKLLFGNGVVAAEKFLGAWDFEAWKLKFRNQGLEPNVEEICEQCFEQGIEQDSGKSVEESSEQDIEENSDLGLGQGLEEDSGQGFEVNLGQGSERVIVGDSEQSYEEGSKQGVEQDFGLGLGQGSEKSVEHGLERNIEENSEQSLKLDSERGIEGDLEESVKGNHERGVES